MEYDYDKYKLIIAPDSSSNQFDEHKYLKTQMGIDILVLDHHEAENISEYACVINNQLSDYPTKSLAGVGVVYKFCSYLDEIMNTNYAKDYMDLVSLGCVADMVELKDFETRHLVVSGINNVNNPFFKGMVDKQAFSLKDGLTPFGIAFYIAPYVNATIRVGTLEEKRLLFESMLDYKGYENIPSTKRGCKGQDETRLEQACRNCSNIKNRQTKARDASLEIIESIIIQDGLLDNKILIVRLEESDETMASITGLIANQLMDHYKRPVLLLRKTELGWEGSARTVGGSKLDNFKDFLEESKLFEYCAGHQGAFGVGITNENLEEFIKYSNYQLRDTDFSPIYQVDFIYDKKELRDKDILEIASLENVWGKGVEEALVAVENIVIKKDDITLLSADKNPTLKIRLSDNCYAIKFRSSKEEYEKLYSELGCVNINIVGKCKRNIWNGNITPQILVEDYEIVNRQDYYF
jgi:single-stranded-DNA-specific exonuclease